MVLWVMRRAQSSECVLVRTLNSVHGHTADQLQSDGNLAVWMSQISIEWRECSIMTLSTNHWVSGQDKGSKILCGKLGASKITPHDCLYQEYLIIIPWSTSDWQHLKLQRVRLFGRWRRRCWDRECRRRSSVRPLKLSDTAATSQNGSSLEWLQPSQVGSALFWMQVAEGCEREVNYCR